VRINSVLIGMTTETLDEVDKKSLNKILNCITWLLKNGTRLFPFKYPDVSMSEKLFTQNTTDEEEVGKFLQKIENFNLLNLETVFLFIFYKRVQKCL
jgi:hypothetical protein